MVVCVLPLVEIYAMVDAGIVCSENMIVGFLRWR
jgi:hypothetical protein